MKSVLHTITMLNLSRPILALWAQSKTFWKAHNLTIPKRLCVIVEKLLWAEKFGRTVFGGQNSLLSSLLQSLLSSLHTPLTSALCHWFLPINEPPRDGERLIAHRHPSTKGLLATFNCLGIVSAVHLCQCDGGVFGWILSAGMLAQSVRCTRQSSIHRLQCICRSKQPCDRFDFLVEGIIDLNVGRKLVIWQPPRLQTFRLTLPTSHSIPWQYRNIASNIDTTASTKKYLRGKNCDDSNSSCIDTPFSPSVWRFRGKQAHSSGTQYT